MSAHRIDVHQHVVPPFYAKALPDHGGNPSGASFTVKLDCDGSLTREEHEAINHKNAWSLFPRLVLQDAKTHRQRASGKDVQALS
jgi:hypothetical protein